ncbi:MAG: hypothetical protein ACR2JP_06850 [Acidimicrobiia bacterium]
MTDHTGRTPVTKLVAERERLPSPQHRVEIERRRRIETQVGGATVTGTGRLRIRPAPTGTRNARRRPSWRRRDLAAVVASKLKIRWSPHAICA